MYEPNCEPDTVPTTDRVEKKMFKTRVIEINDGKNLKHYQREFFNQPRIGEWITLKVNDLGCVFEIIQIVHNDEVEEFDIYVKLVGSQNEASHYLREKIYSQ